MKYPYDVVLSSCVPKLIGSYEEELLRFIEEIIQKALLHRSEHRVCRRLLRSRIRIKNAGRDRLCFRYRPNCAALLC